MYLKKQNKKVKDQSTGRKLLKIHTLHMRKLFAKQMAERTSKNKMLQEKAKENGKSRKILKRKLQNLLSFKKRHAYA